MADKPYETRTVTAQVEYRDDGDAGPTIVGHAATFNQPYQVGFFTETIHPDAFKRTLSMGPDVRLLVDHEGQPLARTKSGTLELGTDERGLTVRATLDPSDPDVQRLIPKMRRGDMDQMSFAFRVPSGGDAWDHSSDTPQRTIREANLSGGDVSIVTYPANENASVSLRSQDERDAHVTLMHALIEEKRAGRPVNEATLRDVWTALMAEPLPEPRTEKPSPIEQIDIFLTEDAKASDKRQASGFDLEVARYLADQARQQRA